MVNMCSENPRAGPLSGPARKGNAAVTGASVDIIWGMVTVSQCKLMNSIHNHAPGTSQAKLRFAVAVADRSTQLGPPALGCVYMIDVHVDGRYTLVQTHN